MGGFAEDDKTKAHAAVPDGAAVADAWTAIATTANNLGVKAMNIQTGGSGTFDATIRQALFTIGQSTTDIALRATVAAKQAKSQVLADTQGNQRLAEDTAKLQAAQLVADARSAAAARNPGNASLATAATEAQTAAGNADLVRAGHLADWKTMATTNTAPLPGHGAEVQAAAQRAVAAQVVEQGSSPTPTTGTTPTVTANNPSPSSPSKTANPAKTEAPSKANPSPEDNKKGGDDKPSDTASAAKPNQQQQGQQGQQPNAGQQQQPQGGAPGATPQGGQPGAAKPGAVAPITTPTPVPVGNRSTERGSGGPKPAATLPAKPTLPNGGGKVLGTGAGAVPASAISAANAGRGGAGGAGTGGSGTGSSQRGATGGMPMGAGHGAGGGQQGGGARPKGEVKDRGDRDDLRGARTEAESTGGVADEGHEPPRGPDNPSTESVSDTATPPPMPPVPPVSPTK